MKISLEKAKELLFGGFEKAKVVLSDSSKINELLSNTEEKLKKIPYLGGTLSDVPILLQMLNDGVHKKYNIPVQTLLIIVSAIMYFVLPFDFISDAIPVLGLIDDIKIIELCCQMVGPDINNYKEWKNNINENKMEEKNSHNESSRHNKGYL